MKKLTIIISMLVILALLAACGGNADAAENTTVQGSETSQDTTPPEGFEFEVPLQTALIVGTFELEGTENQVTAEQAAELLPLWMVLKNLLESDTAAAEEIDALTNQISETMTESQMEVINNLDLGPQSLRDMMAELGLSELPEGTEGTGSPGANRPEGMPQGMGPGGGGGGGQGSTGLTPEQMESFQATREASGGGQGSRMGGFGNTALIDALIELLQSK